MAQTGKNKWFFLPHLLSASVYYSAKPADRWRLILANVKEWISVPYLSLLISQPEARAGLFWAWQVYASSPDSKIDLLHHYRKPLKDIIRDRMYCCCFANNSWLKVLWFSCSCLNLNLVSWPLDLYESRSKPVITLQKCQIPPWLTFWGILVLIQHEWMSCAVHFWQVSTSYSSC